MRKALNEKEVDAGVVWKLMPGCPFACKRNSECKNTEAKEVRVRSLPFADDTTIVGVKCEMNE